MTKEEKLVVIDSLAEQLRTYPHFYITDIEALNAEQTASLRRKCFEKEIKLVVVKNTLLTKALEKVEKADAELVKVLEGPTSVMFANVAKAPAALSRNSAKALTSPYSRRRSPKGAYTWATTRSTLSATSSRRKNSSATSSRCCSLLRRMLSLHCKPVQARRLRAS